MGWERADQPPNFERCPASSLRSEDPQDNRDGTPHGSWDSFQGRVGSPCRRLNQSGRYSRAIPIKSSHGGLGSFQQLRVTKVLTESLEERLIPFVGSKR